MLLLESVLMGIANNQTIKARNENIALFYGLTKRLEIFSTDTTISLRLQKIHLTSLFFHFLTHSMGIIILLSVLVDTLSMWTHHRYTLCLIII